MEQLGTGKGGGSDEKNQVQETVSNSTATAVKKVKTTNKRDDSSEATFNQIRVGYGALCIETSHGWECARSSDKLATQDIGQDPLQLVDIAGIYKDKVIWSLPFWVTITCTGIAYLMVLANAIPMPCLTIPAYTKKLAAGALGIASISALGGMILSGVISSSVSTIVGKVTLDAIEVHTGRMILSFGWTVFSLVTVSFIGVCAVVVAEWGVNKVAAVVEERAERGMSTTTGGMYGVTDGQSAQAKLEALKNGRALQGGFAFAKSMRK